ncbi:LOB domain-containing protein 6-like isoform X1 [Asparagus officinalis]|uniref:LOB domain-containing protein 6-like isoform X1 n=1 Tax=Asparagus officinalis TaxID=4686 RepID=UPI00098E759E|nr:LOB domain-containing protein 6-like isoform X1 [Asparagus officinalis]
MMMPSSSAFPHSTALSSLGSSSTMTSSPCAACKFLRRKCQPDCVFAPYFPPDNPQKFVNVHKVFGASNVTKILNDLDRDQREDAVNSLAYEADMRLKDPVYGCVGIISILQHQLRQLQLDLTLAKAELSKYQNQNITSPSNYPHFLMSRESSGSAGYYQQPQQHMIMLRSYEVELATTATRMGVNGEYDAPAMAGNGTSAGSVGACGGQFFKTTANGDAREERHRFRSLRRSIGGNET